MGCRLETLPTVKTVGCRKESLPTVKTVGGEAGVYLHPDGLSHYALLRINEKDKWKGGSRNESEIYKNKIYYFECAEIGERFKLRM